jgi:hypothetical protein
MAKIKFFLSKLGIEGNFINLLKDSCEKHRATIILNGENHFPKIGQQDRDVYSYHC